MRTKNGMLNILSGISIRLVTLVLTFISRTIFIQTLGLVYLGFNGLMTNIFMLLAIAELGIGTAISYSLYKPLANGERNKIVALMQFYKKAYRIIGVIVIILGLLLMPILYEFIDELSKVENFVIVYIIFLLQITIPYFINYKVLLLIADQKEYRLTKINLIFTVINTCAQIGILFLTQNYLIYLIGILIVNTLQILVINIFVDKKYEYIKLTINEKISKEDFAEIKKNVKAMFFHKIGDFSINGTDNLIISFFISLTLIGLYSNYTMLILSINGLLLVFFNSLTASMGNLIATSTELKRKEVFESINFIAFVLYSLIFIVLINVIDTVIILWLGEEFLLSTEIVVAILINFYLTGMRVPLAMIKNAAGLHDVDKYSPLIQSAINLVLSIILVQELGLFGVFLGTAISSIALPCWQRPYLVYKYLFKSSSKVYFLKYLIQLVLMSLIVYITLSINNRFFDEVSFIHLILNVVITTVITLTAIVIVFYRTKEFKYLLKKLNIKNVLARKCKN